MSHLPLPSSLASTSSLLGWQALLRFQRFTLLFRKYSPNQPRIPAGQPNAGQFTFGNGESSDPKDPARQQFAQHTPRPPRGRAAGRWPDATPGQEARLAASEAEANSATARVRSIDGGWRPEPSIYKNIEGEILHNQNIARQAQATIENLRSMKAMFGPYKVESIPARGGRRLSSEDQREINRIGRQFGCHSCGTLEPGTRSGNFIGDHQSPFALRGEGQLEVVPHCIACSNSQGGHMSRYLYRRR